MYRTFENWPCVERQRAWSGGANRGLGVEVRISRCMLWLSEDVYT